MVGLLTVILLLLAVTLFPSICSHIMLPNAAARDNHFITDTGTTVKTLDPIALRCSSRKETEIKYQKNELHRLLLHANANGNDMLCLLQMAIDGTRTLWIRIQDAETKVHQKKKN